MDHEAAWAIMAHSEALEDPHIERATPYPLVVAGHDNLALRHF